MRPVPVIMTCIALVLLAGMTWGFSSSSTTSSMATSYALKTLEQAAWSAESTLSGLEESGFVSWTPEAAARETADVLNAVLRENPDDRYPPPPGPRITYVVGAVSGPWQVVLTPLPNVQQIRIEGYGPDTHAPLLSRTARCPGSTAKSP
jgi:hypothetical protein